MRNRYLIIFGMAIAVMVALFLTDPAAGLLSFEKVPVSAIALLGVFAVFIAVGCAHISRKGLFDWFDMQEYATKALTDPVGSGLVVVGVCYVLGQLIAAFAGALPR